SSSPLCQPERCRNSPGLAAASGESVSACASVVQGPQTNHFERDGAIGLTQRIERLPYRTLSHPKSICTVRWRRYQILRRLVNARIIDCILDRIRHIQGYAIWPKSFDNSVAGAWERTTSGPRRVGGKLAETKLPNPSGC